MIKHINLTNGRQTFIYYANVFKNQSMRWVPRPFIGEEDAQKLNVNGAPQEKRKDRAIQEISSLFGMPQKSATKVMPIKKASKKPINPLLSVLTKSIDRKKKGTDNVSIETGQS